MINVINWYFSTMQAFDFPEKVDILSNNGNNIKIALLDSGIAYNKSIFKNSSIIARNFIKGEDFIDFTGHGTKNSSLLVAEGNSKVQGIIPNCTLLVAKVLGNSKSHDEHIKAVAKAIRWAVNESADIIIMPFGKTKSSKIIIQEIRRGLAKKIKFFASAGNRGADTILFPAYVRGVTSVSALDLDGKPLDFCCQLSMVDQYVSGDRIKCIGIDGVETISGSSPACVIAAGLEGLRLSYKKRLLNKENRDVLL